MASRHDERVANIRRARALPWFRYGYIPPEKDLDVKDDSSGFRDVLRLFLRSWPYIRPQLLGNWFRPKLGTENRVADTIASEGFHFYYAPFLLLLLAIAGPFLGIVEASYKWPYALLYVPAGTLCAGMFGMAFGKKDIQFWATILTVLSGVAINLVATYVIDGIADGVYAVVLTVAAIFGWIVQFRMVDFQFEYRIRVSTHLVYFYAIQFTQRFIGLGLGLITADLLNQNLLQGEPIAPGLAEFLGVPEWAQGTIEEMTKEQRIELLWLYLKIIITFYLVQFPINIFNGYYNIWIMQRINQDLRVALVERWHQLSMNYHSDHRTGDSIFRIYQDSSQVTVVIGHLINLTISVFSYFSCVGLVMLLDIWIGLMAGLILIPGFMWAAYAMPRVRVRSLVYRAASSDVTSTVQEAFSAIRLIKSFNNTAKAQERLERDSIISFNAAYRIRSLIAVVTIFMFTITATFMITGEFLMAWWAYQEEPTFATDLIALVGVSFVVWNLASFEWTKGEFRGAANNTRGILRNWMTAQDMAMGLRRVFNILDIEPDVLDEPDAVPFEEFKQEIEFKDINFHYQPDRPVLSDVNLTAKPGTITAVIGPTGSGKSSLMALLLRLFDPQGGQISIDGKDLREYQVATLRRNISIALQENVLFAMSVRNNITYVSPNATAKQIDDAVRVSGMADYVAGLPNGLDTILSDRGGKLSSGQRQRLSIARAVVKDTPILVLDEPTAALDAATEHLVMDNLAEWGVGRAIFVITHRISTIRRADNIVYLDGGRILESGTHEELMQVPDGHYRGFVETELNLTNG